MHNTFEMFLFQGTRGHETAQLELRRKTLQVLFSYCFVVSGKISEEHFVLKP